MQRENQTRLQFVLGVSFVASVVSCGGDQYIEPTNGHTDVLPKTSEFREDAFLVFETRDAYDRTRRKLAGADEDALTAWSTQFEGFSSKWAHLKSLESRTTGLDVPNIYDYELGVEFLINKLGVVQIGEQIFLHRGKRIFVIEDGNIDTLGLVDSHQEGSKELAINYIDVIQAGTTSFSSSLGNESCTGEKGGERVVGTTRAYEYRYTNLYNGTITIQPRFSVVASNYERLFWPLGWTLKPTGGLQIRGTVTTQAGTWQIIDSNINISSVGNPVRQLFWERYGEPLILSLGDPIPIGPVFSPFRFSGFVEFRGRNGTRCDIGRVPPRPPPPPPPPPPECGNGICGPGETRRNCGRDCYCGNGSCEGQEVITCPSDCRVGPCTEPPCDPV